MAPRKKVVEYPVAQMQAGRLEAKAVRSYLEAIEAHRPKRGRKRTPESVGRRLEQIAAEFDAVDALTRLNLAQERMDLELELIAMGQGDDIEALETEFVKVAAAYAERKKISYAAFRSVGVEPRVLKEAGIGRTD